MNKLRILSVVTAAILSTALFSCSLRNFDDSSSEAEKTTAATSATEVAYDNENLSVTDAPALDEIREHANELLDSMKINGNDRKVKNCIDALLLDMDKCNQEYSLRTVEFYQDWLNEELEAEYDSCYETLYIADQIMTFVFSKGFKNDEYSHLFTELTDEEIAESYAAPGMSLKRIEGYARVDFDVMDDCIDQYYSIYNDEELDDDEKALMCAELYLELLGSFDTDTFYELYYRDYTPDEMLRLSKIVRDELLPVSDKLYETFYDCDNAYEALYEPIDYDKPFEVILEYTAKLSPDIEKSAKKLIDEQLFTITSGDDSFPGSFTTSLPLDKTALVFIHDHEDNSALQTCIHEFGHFHATAYDNVSSYCAANNLDIAEIQSQGMELLFMQFYDDIYEEQAEALRFYKTIYMLDSVISGFLVGEFEYTVLQNRDTFTPEDVVECFREIMGDYTDYDFFYINHLFESPGYYISYGISALAAFDIWEDCLYSPDEALVKYEKIAKISANDRNYRFKSALEACGFNDVLNEDYILNLAQELSDYADSF